MFMFVLWIGCVLHGHTAVAQIPGLCDASAEHEALVSLYKTTRGEEWTHSTHWLATKDHCSWFGVHCNVGITTCVVSLYLGKNNLVGTIPPVVSTFSTLDTLDLGNNDISGYLPSVLTLLKPLKYLRVSDNKISGTMPNTNSFFKIATADLRGNMISGTLPTSISAMTSITSLYLGDNKLSGTIPSLVKSLLSLQTLDLSYNAISGQIPTLALNMRSLFLSHTSVRGGFSQALPSLMTLDLSHTGISSLPAQDSMFYSWPLMQQFSVANTSVTRIPKPFTVGAACHVFGSLVSLDISGVPLPNGRLDEDVLFHKQPPCPEFLMRTTTLLSVTAQNSNIRYVDLSHHDRLVNVRLAGNALQSLPVLPPLAFYVDIDAALVDDVVVSRPFANLVGPARVYMQHNSRALLRLPEVLVSTGEVVDDIDRKLSCSSGFSSPSEITFFMDAAMFRYSPRMCTCFRGYHGNIAEDGTGCKLNGDLCEPGDSGCAVVDDTTGALACGPHHWPAPSRERVSTFEKCQFCTAETTPCAVAPGDGSVSCAFTSECEEGHTDRLCERCLPGYYKKNGFECVRCPAKKGERLQGKLLPVAAAVAIISGTYAHAFLTHDGRVAMAGCSAGARRHRAPLCATMVAVVGAAVALAAVYEALSAVEAVAVGGTGLVASLVLFVLLGRSSEDYAPVSASESHLQREPASLAAAKGRAKVALRVAKGLVKSATVYVQTMHVLRTPVLPTATTLSGVAGFYVESGMECVLPRVCEDRPFSCLLYLNVSMPACILAIVWAASALGCACSSRPAAVLHAAVKTTVLVLFVMLPRTFFVLLAAFKCTPESVCAGCEPSGREFLEEAPWVACWREDHHTLMLVASIAAAVYGAGAAVLFAMMARSRRGDPDGKPDDVYGLLWGSYRGPCWWFEAAVLLRRILVVSALSLFRDGLPMGRFIVAAVLFVSTVVHMEARAYLDNITYRMEMVGLGVPLLTHVATNIVASSQCYPYSDCAEPYRLVFSTAHTLTLLAYSLCLLRVAWMLNPPKSTNQQKK